MKAIKKFMLITTLLIGGCGLVSGAFAWGAVQSGNVLSIQVVYAPAQEPLGESELAAIQLHDEMREGR